MLPGLRKSKPKIDSFILKFKILVGVGRNACLRIQASAEKAYENLNVELEYAAGGDHSHHGSVQMPSLRMNP